MDDNLSHVAQKPKLNLVIPLLIIIILLLLFYSMFLFNQNNKLKLENINTNKINTPASNIVSPIPGQDKIAPTSIIKEYKIAKYGGIFSYEYPADWHVAELWQESSKQGIIIAIDPKPISTSPRGGPLATFEIRVINGQPNPNEVFSEEMSKFNQENYSNIIKETINSDLGLIYHYQGKINGEMLKGEPMENYYLTFETNKNDPSNQQIIIASMALKNDLKLSEMLRHIVLSIKKLQ